MVIHFLVADAPVETVETAEETQQSIKFIVIGDNYRLTTRCKGKMDKKMYEGNIRCSDAL